MPFGFLFSEPAQIAYVTASGDITLQLCVESAAKLFSHPDFQSQYDVVANFTETTRTPTKAEFLEFVATVRKHKDSFHGSLALIMKPGDLQRPRILSTLARLFGVRMGVFDNVAGAMEFIYKGRGC